MVTVKLFGTFRLDTRLKVVELEASSVKELLPLIMAEVKKLDPSTQLTEKDLKGCIISVNGKQSKLRAKLNNGDEVCLMPAVAGG